MPFTVAFVAYREAKEVLRKLNYCREWLKQDETFAYGYGWSLGWREASGKNVDLFGVSNEKSRRESFMDEHFLSA